MSRMIQYEIIGEKEDETIKKNTIQIPKKYVEIKEQNKNDEYKKNMELIKQLSVYSLIDKKCNILSTFAHDICIGRDSTHGYEHLKNVAITARLIALTDYNYKTYPNLDNLILDVLTVGWLHDVADYKYDYDGTLQTKLDDFGYKNILNYENIKKVINLISLTKENEAVEEGKTIDYNKILGEHYQLVRQIVSDADKLEAIGKDGIQRCINYVSFKNPTLSKNEIYKLVIDYANNKLIKIKDHFIKTKTGKILSETLHKEMVELINYLTFCVNYKPL
jgi:HD superfamily phosphodiesterase